MRGRGGQGAIGGRRDDAGRRHRRRRRRQRRGRWGRAGGWVTGWGHCRGVHFIRAGGGWGRAARTDLGAEGGGGGGGGGEGGAAGGRGEAGGGGGGGEGCRRRRRARMRGGAGAAGRGLHSSTFRLNVSAFCGKGGAFMDRLGGVSEVSGDIRGYLGCILCQKRLRLS